MSFRLERPLFLNFGRSFVAFCRHFDTRPMMNPVAILTRKRQGQALTGMEIEFFVKESVAGRVPDYQIAAFLMAVAIQGMNPQETWALTKAMRNSGRQLDFSGVSGPKVDKHSTGGVGDGTSLVLAPLVATFGIRVPMMPGRSLGHTGGTLDKWEAVPGFDIHPPRDQWKHILEKTGCLLISPDSDLAPADAKFYALRDVTATVDSLPLIVSSILSKKLSEGAQALVFDVKVGSGAFLPELSEARALARSLVSTSRKAGCRSVAALSDMEQPLGRAVGNALEVKQAIKALKGQGPWDFVELTLELAYWMLRMGGIRGSRTQLLSALRQKLLNGEALSRFAMLVEAQGGDPGIVKDSQDLLPRAKREADFVSSKAGYVTMLNARDIGGASVELGAGRKTVEDPIDPAAGVFLHKKVGETVRKGEPLATVYAATRDRIDKGLEYLNRAYRIGSQPVQRRPLIQGVIGA